MQGYKVPHIFGVKYAFFVWILRKKIHGFYGSVIFPPPLGSKKFLTHCDMAVIDWEVIIVANRSVYLENVISKKIFIFLEGMNGQVACRYQTWLTWPMETFNVNLLREEP